MSQILFGYSLDTTNVGWIPIARTFFHVARPQNDPFLVAIMTYHFYLVIIAMLLAGFEDDRLVDYAIVAFAFYHYFSARNCVQYLLWVVPFAIAAHDRLFKYYLATATGTLVGFYSLIFGRWMGGKGVLPSGFVLPEPLRQPLFDYMNVATWAICLIWALLCLWRMRPSRDLTEKNLLRIVARLRWSRL